MDGRLPSSVDDEIDVLIDAPAWRAASEDIETIVRESALLALKGGRGRGTVCVMLADDAAVRVLNKQFLGRDKATNVLSFPAPTNRAGLLGDVILAYETLARESAEQSKPFKAHLQHLVVHGVLHLLGFDHETEAQAVIMEALESRLLKSLGIPDPYRTEQTGD